VLVTEFEHEIAESGERRNPSVEAAFAARDEGMKGRGNMLRSGRVALRSSGVLSRSSSRCSWITLRTAVPVQAPPFAFRAARTAGCGWARTTRRCQQTGGPCARRACAEGDLRSISRLPRAAARRAA
jgi:hypothetical protein